MVSVLQEREDQRSAARWRRWRDDLTLTCLVDTDVVYHVIRPLTVVQCLRDILSMKCGRKLFEVTQMQEAR